MRHVGIVCVGGLVAVLSAGGGVRAQGAFEYAFRVAPELPAPDLGPTQDASDPLAMDCIENDGPDWPAGSDVLAGPAGRVAQSSYYCTLEQLDPGITPGAQGWQLSVAAQNGSIEGITVAQTEISLGDVASCEVGPGGTGGFNNTELALAVDNGGVAGGISAVVLHLKKLTTLDPTGSNAEPATGPEQNPVTVARILVSAVLPEENDPDGIMTLMYMDGLMASGKVVDNKVTQDEQSVLPSKATKEITLLKSEFAIGWSNSPPQPAPDLGPTQDPSDPLALDCIENDGPDWPAGSDVLAGPAGTIARGSYYCTLEQLDPGISSGAQGWQLSMTAQNGSIDAITVTQTDISPGDIASCELGPGATGGFDNTELALPENNGGVGGAVSVVVLHLKKLTTLDPTGSNTVPATGAQQNPATVARILVSAVLPEENDPDGVMTLTYVDGLMASGQEVDNKITQDQQSVLPTTATKEISLQAITSFAIGWSNSPPQPAPDLGPTQDPSDPLALDCIENDGPDWPAGSDVLAGPAGTIARGSYYCTLEQLDPGISSGAQGWQLSMTAQNGSIDAITVTQTDISPGDIASCELGPGATGGFDNTELALPENNGGVGGAVSAVVLHLKKLTTLDPTGSNTVPATGPQQNPATVARILVSAVLPNAISEIGQGGVVTLTYVDGLMASGQVVDNKVTQDEQSARPTTATKEISLQISSSFAYGWRNAPQQPAPDLGPTQDASDPLALDCIENDGPDWPAGSDSRSGPPGTVSQGSYYCTLEQLDPGTTPGAQGWQISFTATGCDAVVSGITVTQTEISPGNIASCEAGPGATGGFDSTELALPEDNGGVAGAVSAVVLHFKKLTTLDATGSNTEPATGPEQNPVAVCRFLIAYTIPATEGDSCDVTLSYIDGLQSGGNPVPNKVTQDGQSVVPQVAQKTITVTASAGQQLAGDCNQDGDFDISDAICLLGFLFQATPPALPCGPLGNSPENLAVFDVNGDASIDLSDAVFKLAFLFSGGPPLVQGTDCFAADCAVDNPGCS